MYINFKITFTCTSKIYWRILFLTVLIILYKTYPKMISMQTKCKSNIQTLTCKEKVRRIDS